MKYEINKALKSSNLLFSLLLFMVPFLTGCEKNLMSKIVDPTASNTTGIWSGKWTIYDDEVKTGGADMLYTQGVSIDFKNTDNPHSGKQCIKFSWDGSPVLTYKSLPTHPTDYMQSDFTGFGLICAKTVDGYSTGARNLSLGGYNKITFYAKGHLNDHVYLRVEANSDNPNVSKLPSGSVGVWMGTMGTINADWPSQPYTLSIDKNINKLASAVDFVKFILVYDDDGDPSTPNTSSANNGGTIYLDDIMLSN